MNNGLVKTLLKWVVGAAAAWLVLSSLAPARNYGRLTLGLLLLWLCLVWLKQYVQQARGGEKGWLNWGVNTVLAIIPGLILLWYGFFTPAQPSLTNSGIDVCALQTGWCVSGNRALGFWGGAALLAGLGWSYFTFTIEQKTKGR